MNLMVHRSLYHLTIPPVPHPPQSVLIISVLADLSNDKAMQMIPDSYSTIPALVLDLLQTYRSSYAC